MIKIEKVEVIKIFDEKEPKLIYLLPSGFENRVIHVYETPYEELEVKYISKKERDKIIDFISEKEK